MIHQKNRLHNILIRENDPDFCRENIIMGKSKKHPVGTVIGRRLFSVPETGTGGSGNTGFGIMDNISIDMLAMYGLYTATCIKAEAGGGVFMVTTPEGVRLPDAVVGIPFVSPHINFTINDGDPDFVVGDSIVVEVTPGDGKAFQLNFNATDGTQIPYGFTIENYDATDSDARGVVIKEKALIRASGLVWPENITEEQKGAALAALASRSILDREGA